MKNTLYQYQFTCRLHDTDAAGVMFFARTFYYLHDAYEEFLANHNFPISDILLNHFLLPVSYAEADFRAPVFLNDVISVKMFLENKQKDQFSLYFEFKNKNQILTQTALTRHTCLDADSRKKIPLPTRLNDILRY